MIIPLDMLAEEHDTVSGTLTVLQLIMLKTNLFLALSHYLDNRQLQVDMGHPHLTSISMFPLLTMGIIFLLSNAFTFLLCMCIVNLQTAFYP